MDVNQKDIEKKLEQNKILKTVVALLMAALFSVIIVGLVRLLTNWFGLTELEAALSLLVGGSAFMGVIKSKH